MKGSRKFILIFIGVFIVYVIAELNRPKPVNWSVSINKTDKIPYGGYVLYSRLHDLFPDAEITTMNRSLYEEMMYGLDMNSAYIIISPEFSPSKSDIENLLTTVYDDGNTVFIAASNFGKSFLDSFHIKTNRRPSLINGDSNSVNFTSPALRVSKPYSFFSNTIDEYFSKIDTAATTVLGTNDRSQPNFIKVEYGEGLLYLHSAPLCFSNMFILHNNNAEYTAKCLSYLPRNADVVYWDEYYKPGESYADTPLRFFLSSPYLLWALRVAMLGLIIYVLFEMKRRQRLIPVVEPLRNSSLDFVRTVSSVYFNQKDNNGIAQKKISYFFDFVRQRFFIQTQTIDNDFVQTLARKSGINLQEIQNLADVIHTVNNNGSVGDALLMQLDEHIDNFYKQV